MVPNTAGKHDKKNANGIDGPKRLIVDSPFLHLGWEIKRNNYTSITPARQPIAQLVGVLEYQFNRIPPAIPNITKLYLH